MCSTATPPKPDGIVGKPALLAYLRKLLAAFPDWIWRADDGFPIEGGFTLRWKAEIPVKGKVIHETGGIGSGSSCATGRTG
jgi:hypothetical protein